MPDLVILTGGEKTRSKVSVYNMREYEYEYDMPDLQTGRADHGCGYFINEENTKVNKAKNTILIIKWYPNVVCQVLLVTGGSSDNGYGNDIDTTEVYVHATAEWKFSARLPGNKTFSL